MMQEHSVLVEKHKQCQPLAPIRRGEQVALMAQEKMEERRWKADVMARLNRLLDDMGWDENDLADHLHEEMGLGKKAVQQWFARQSVPAYKLTIIAGALGVDLRYLMAAPGVDSPQPEPKSLYAREKRLHDMETELVLLRAQRGVG